VQITAVANPFLRPVFLSYPYSHSLLMLIIWAILLGALGRARTRDNKTFTVLLLLVISHWLLDFTTHRPDMPLYPGSRQFGLGLWNSPLLTVAIEVPLYVAGVAIYASATQPHDRIGTWAFWAFVLFLLIAYLGSLLGPPPPSIPALYGSAIGAGALLLVWSWWADRHRMLRTRQMNEERSGDR
jgi:hypothetical protein